MTQDDLVEILADYAGPLGPFRDEVDQERAFQEALSSLNWEHFLLLLKILKEPPAIAGHPSCAPGWAVAIEAALVTLGKVNTREALTHLGPVARMSHPSRINAVSVLGGLGDQSALAPLSDLVDDPSLDEEELIALACALGEVGGEVATELLHELAETHTTVPSVIREVAIALKHIEIKHIEEGLSPA